MLGFFSESAGFEAENRVSVRRSEEEEQTENQMNPVMDVDVVVGVVLNEIDSEREELCSDG